MIYHPIDNDSFSYAYINLNVYLHLSSSKTPNAFMLKTIFLCSHYILGVINVKIAATLTFSIGP